MAKAGAKVALLDKEAFPREKVRGVPLTRCSWRHTSSRRVPI